MSFKDVAKTLCLLAALACAAVRPAAAAELTRIRMGQHQDFTRIVVDLTGAVTWRTETAADGVHLTLHGDGGRLMPHPELRFDGVGLVTGAVMRADEAGNGAVSLAVQAQVKLERVFLLQPDGDHSWRLVIDVARGGDPLPQAVQAEPAPAAPQVAIAAPAPAVALADATPPEPEPTPGRLNRIASAAGPQVKFSGFVETETRLFPKHSADGVPWRADASVAAQPELKMVWNDGVTTATVTPFARADAQESGGRTHADLREFKITHKSGNFKITLGFDRVFWGVAESVHQVNILNQIDMVEDIDGETRLGQPMVALSDTTPAGTFSVYLLPYFRERTFPTSHGRPRAPLNVDTELTTYQSKDRHWHPDVAIRWCDTIGVLDVGLAYFSGTNRQPLLQPAVNSRGQLVVAPHYELIDQASIDAQATLGGWLLKAEGYVRWGQTDPLTLQTRTFGAGTVGFEYTISQIRKSSWDVGLVAEYSFDTRGRRAWENAFQNDIFVGLRITPNDAQDTEFLGGSFYDFNSGAWLAKIKASRRIGANWKLSFDARLPNHARARDPLLYLVDDGFVQIRLGYYF